MAIIEDTCHLRFHHASILVFEVFSVRPNLPSHTGEKERKKRKRKRKSMRKAHFSSSFY